MLKKSKKSKYLKNTFKQHLHSPSRDLFTSNSIPSHPVIPLLQSKHTNYLLSPFNYSKTPMPCQSNDAPPTFMKPCF